MDPSSFKDLLASSTAVVHTLGVLLESDYKSGGLGGVASALGSRFTSSSYANPLAHQHTPRRRGVYETMNRDTGSLSSPINYCNSLTTLSALAVYEAFQDASPLISSSKSNPFVYISAEDVFRPFVPSRYISTKREAEREMDRLCSAHEVQELHYDARPTLRPYYVRPSELLIQKGRPI